MPYSAVDAVINPLNHVREITPVRRKVSAEIVADVLNV